ncbi:MAG: N-acetylmuramoyl-L-alanine amidase [Planctomycetota bacterium]|nr:MAG: N-acetylmuramoyl-L-alanine amidase [Planctomycetota bacterium]
MARARNSRTTKRKRYALGKRVLALSWGLGVLAGCAGGGAGYQPEPYPVYTLNRPTRPPTKTTPTKPTAPPPTRRARPPRGHWPAAWYPPGGRISRRWTTIVIHHSATDRGGAKRFDAYHRLHNGWDELGYHFVIGNGTDTPDGYVEVGPRWRKQKHGAHCKTPDNYFNDHGIGICLVGDFTRGSPTPRQMASLRRLIRFLTTECNIPYSRITTHRAVNPHTRCPGPGFSLAGLIRTLRGPTAAASIPHR